MEIQSNRLPDGQNPLDSVANIPAWLKQLKIGDFLEFTNSHTLKANGAPDEIIERIENSKKSGKKLTLTDAFVKYLEIHQGEYFGILKMADGSEVECPISWLEPQPLKKGVDFKPWSIIGSKPSAKDLEEMKSHVDIERFTSMLRYANGGRPIDSTVVNKYLDTWATAKWDLYCMFGKKLLLSEQVEFEIDNNEMSSLQLSLMKEFPQYAPWLHFFGPRNFVSNTTDGFDHEILSKIGIQKPGSMKLSKFLSSVVNDEHFDVALSKVLQNRMIKGSFYVSIDPYDYLTISTNKHGWTSCADFTGARGNGNSQGSFSYLLDTTTMVCFRSNNKEYEYSVKNASFVGNSKSWRQLVHINKENCALMFNRQYPQNSSLDTAKMVRELLERQLSTYLGRENKWENLGSNDEYYKPSVRLAYNDSHNNTRLTIVPFGTPLNFIIDSGAKVYCLGCGKHGERVNCCS